MNHDYYGLKVKYVLGNYKCINVVVYTIIFSFFIFLKTFFYENSRKKKTVTGEFIV